MTPEQARNTIAQQTPVPGVVGVDIKYADWKTLQLSFFNGIMPLEDFTKCEDRAMALYAEKPGSELLRLHSSKCCSADYWVSTGGEGTSCHVCYKCGKACDLNYYALEFETLFTEHQKFAKERFPESTWQSSLEGLKREIKEVEDADKSNFDAWIIEYIDCLKYLLDSIYRAGASINDIKRLFRKKLEINKNREWSKNPDNSYSHIKS